MDCLEVAVRESVEKLGGVNCNPWLAYAPSDPKSFVPNPVPLA